jgi:hypothetical protein
MVAKTQREVQMNEYKNLAAAYHEAGHACVAIYFREKVDSVELFDGRADGVTGQFNSVPKEQQLPSGDRGYDELRKILQRLGGPPPEQLHRYLVNYLAGGVAEHKFTGAVPGHGSDLEQCRLLLDSINLSEDSRREVCAAALKKARWICDEFWLPIQTLASRLVVHRRLNETQIRAAVRSAGNYGLALLGEPVPKGHGALPQEPVSNRTMALPDRHRMTIHDYVTGFPLRTAGGNLEPIITTLVDENGEPIDYIVDPKTGQRRFLDFMNRR